MNRKYPLLWALLLAAICLTKPIFAKPDPYLVATQAKGGSHLLLKVLKMIDQPRPYKLFAHYDQENFSPHLIDDCYKNGAIPRLHLFAPKFTYEYLHAHHSEFKVIVILRDLRDAYVSYAHWIEKDPNTTEEIKINRAFEDQGYFQMSSNLSLFLDDPRFYVIRFEDLVGPKGGGDKKRQTQTIYNLAAYIGMPISYAKASKLGDDLFGGKTMTFRKGQIGSWNEACNEEQKSWFKEHFASELIRLGYEEDYDW